ncbi:formimidoylglutamate deiminase [Sulfidibacter corallicola]|uniref:Formimidoylglutamate deiminase n=1 Tax=Sulfidibacter corallicola TaxID=2818388 RepID=A0A8A4U1H6_SULCO|nr:formimidoylglutamate deiminase [Sulfidibacter corallicola]QTD52595.1 formimidoylglutamate deiminase [Sulfidibacter corallicola]
MPRFRFDGILTEQGWLEPGFVIADGDGRLLSVSNRAPHDGEPCDRIPGFAVPGFRNAHSHAFQYAMAGLGEHLRGEADDFWSWREAMYDLALRVDLDQMEAIAAMVYAEMLRHGYTAVAEFHYLHHDRDGSLYPRPAAMAQRLMRAADAVGIALTLVPMYYRLGGFGRGALPEQRRFLSGSVDAYQGLVEDARSCAEAFERVRVGVGVHSLRAAEPDEIRRIFGEAPESAPRHLHIAEQVREVDECLRHLGRRPVAWLLDEVPVDHRFHLVHATHVAEFEWRGILERGAHVVLCPSTEGNLGDGFFPIRDYHRAGGSWSIGTDSHIGLSPMEELRWLDYGQRLNDRRRNVLCTRAGDDSGDQLFRTAFEGGRAAMGEPGGAWFPTGEPFDAVILDNAHPLLHHCKPARRMATLIHGLDAGALLGTITAGTWRVRAGEHLDGSAIREHFDAALASLGNR